MKLLFSYYCNLGNMGFIASLQSRVQGDDQGGDRRKKTQTDKNTIVQLLTAGLSGVFLLLKISRPGFKQPRAE